MRWIVFATGLLSILSAQPRKLPVGESDNDAFVLSAKALPDKDAIKAVFGTDFDGAIIPVEVRIAPKEGEKPKISRDDFLLRSDKDGQKSQPFAPSQIAGRGALVVSTGPGGGAGIMGDNNGPVWGGLGGGRPTRMGGDGGVIGNSGGGEGSAEARMQSGAADKDNPLLSVLKQKALPETEITRPVTGYLYFPMEGKHKLKELELTYKGQGGKIMLRFVPAK